MISLSAFRSSGSGRRSAVITASVTMRCCGRGQHKTSVKVHFLCRTASREIMQHATTSLVARVDQEGGRGFVTQDFILKRHAFRIILIEPLIGKFWRREHLR
jgi:hypothetical protein